jgi:amino acid transporter
MSRLVESLLTVASPVFIYEALLIPFEITALSTVLNFWSDDIPPWAIPLACIVSF